MDKLLQYSGMLERFAFLSLLRSGDKILGETVDLPMSKKKGLKIIRKIYKTR